MTERQTHCNHHFVSRSYLEAWHVPGTSRLLEYRQLPNEFKSPKPVGAKCTGFIRHLYSVDLSNRDDIEEYDKSIETDFFTKEIDSPIGPVLKSMRGEKDFNQLTVEQKMLWAKFLIAQWMRVPYMLESLAIRGAARYLEGQAASLLRAEVPTSDEGKEKRRLHVMAVWHSYQQIGRNNMIQSLPTAITSEKLISAVLSAPWAIIDLCKSRLDLVVGDHPLSLTGSLNKDFVMFLPLGPRLLFCAASMPELLRLVRNESQTELVRRMNKESVINARRYVFARNDESEALIRRRLRRPSWDEIEG